MSVESDRAWSPCLVCSRAVSPIVICFSVLRPFLRAQKQSLFGPGPSLSHILMVDVPGLILGIPNRPLSLLQLLAGTGRADLRRAMDHWILFNRHGLILIPTFTHQTRSFHEWLQPDRLNSHAQERGRPDFTQLRRSAKDLEIEGWIQVRDRACKMVWMAESRQRKGAAPPAAV